MHGSADPAAVVRRLADATNAHDLDALVACFTDDYVNETPAHPARGFRGAEQVRRNWTRLFDAIPDLSARTLATCTDGDTVWSEWEMSGTRRDGTRHLMRGVIVFQVAHGQIPAARFYLEQADDAASGIDAEIARVTAETTPHRVQP